MSTCSLTAEKRFEAGHHRRLWWGFLGAVILHSVLVIALPNPEFQPYRLAEQTETVALDVPPSIVVPPPPKEIPKRDVVTEIAPSDDVGADATMSVTVPDLPDFLEGPVPTNRPTFYDAVDEPPVVVKRVFPAYPELARQAELEGVVVLKVGVDESGRVREVLVLESVTGLDEAALDAIYRWRFEPARQRDVPVPAWVVVPMRFSLRD